MIWRLARYRANIYSSSWIPILRLKFGLPPSKKSLKASPLKMMKNTFYFMLKMFSFSRIFVLTFLVMYKNGLTRKLRLISNIMTSQPEQQVITIHITMKFGQFFFENHAENKVQELVPDLFLFFEKALYEVKSSVMHLIRDMLSFDFLWKGLGLVLPPYFMHDFSRKMFLMLHSTNWPNFIVWLPLLLEILGQYAYSNFLKP